MYVYCVTKGLNLSLVGLELYNPRWPQSGNDLLVYTTKQLECQIHANLHSFIQYLPLCLLLKENSVHCLFQVKQNCDKKIICDHCKTLHLEMFII